MRNSTSMKYQFQSQEKENLWNKMALRFIRASHRNMLQRPRTLELLKSSYALSEEDLSRLQIGYNSKPLNINGHKMGLIEKSITLPEGIVFPAKNRESGTITLYLVDENDSSSVTVFPSVDPACTIFGNQESSLLIVVASVIDAYMITHKAHGSAAIIIIPHNTQQLDDYAEYLIATKSRVVCCGYEDHEIDHLKNINSKIEIGCIPGGHTVVEALQDGFDIAQWVRRLKNTHSTLIHTIFS